MQVRRDRQHGAERDGDAAEVHLRPAVPHRAGPGLHGPRGQPSRARRGELPVME